MWQPRIDAFKASGESSIAASLLNKNKPMQKFLHKSSYNRRNSTILAEFFNMEKFATVNLSTIEELAAKNADLEKQNEAIQAKLN